MTRSRPTWPVCGGQRQSSGTEVTERTRGHRKGDHGSHPLTVSPTVLAAVCITKLLDFASKRETASLCGLIASFHSCQDGVQHFLWTFSPCPLPGPAGLCRVLCNESSFSVCQLELMHCVSESSASRDRGLGLLPRTTVSWLWDLRRFLNLFVPHVLSIK